MPMMAIIARRPFAISADSFFCLAFRVADLQVAIWNAQESSILEVSGGTLGVINVLEKLHGACEKDHLSPARQRDLAESSETIWHIFKFQAQGR